MRALDDVYFHALDSWAHAAPVLACRTVVFKNGDRPALSKCHSNVDRWVAENPGYVAVRGWLVMSYRYERHSVVRTPHGELIDITLASPYRFLEHPGSEAEFLDFGARGLNQVLRAKA